MTYFSERDKGPEGRNVTDITPLTWKGLVNAIRTWFDNDYFATAFPFRCGTQICGTDEAWMKSAVGSDFPGISWPLDPLQVPVTYDVLDFIEFCSRRISKPISRTYCTLAWTNHFHMGFDEKAGRAEFQDQVNRIFSRNQLAFVLSEHGEVERVGPAVLREAPAFVFKTGDRDLDLNFGVGAEEIPEP